MRAEQEKNPEARCWPPGASVHLPYNDRRLPHNGSHRLVPSVGLALRQAIAELAPATDASRLEAEVLMAYTLEETRASLLAHPQRILTSDQWSGYWALVRRRASGYPLPYLTGRAEFYGLEFEVTPEVLIPRPETETLVDIALARQPTNVVDVGTGCGCIAISLAIHLPGAVVCGIDISPAALAVAQRNVERHGVAERVQLMVGDVLHPRPEHVCQRPPDLIVSNPPYIPTSKCPSLPASVRDYEPRLALDGGQDGMEIVRELLTQAPAVFQDCSHSMRRGALLIEIGADQRELASQLAHTFLPQATIRIHPDLAGRDRVLEVQM